MIDNALKNQTLEFSILKMPDGSTFHCECGASVFTKINTTTFECNGCRAIFIAELDSGDPTTETENG